MVVAGRGGSTLKRIEQLGGRVLMPLTEVAPQATIALFADPEGHVVRTHVASVASPRGRSRLVSSERE
jgi:hypothetical protein